MAFTAADLSDRISMRTVDLISHQLLSDALVNRDYQGEAQGVAKVRVFVYDSETETTPDSPPTASAITGNTISWPTTTKQDGGAFREMDINQFVTDAFFTEAVNILQLPRDPVEVASRKLARNLAWAFDQNIIGGMLADIAGVSGADTILNSGGGTFIDADGASHGTGDASAAKQLFDAIRRFALYADTTGFGIDAAATARVKWFVIDPPSWLALSNYLLAQNWSDAMNEALVAGRGLFAQGAEMRRRAVIDGVNVFVSAVVPLGAGASGEANDGKAERRYLAGTNAAYTCATQAAITEIFPMGMNPIGDGTTGGIQKIGSLARTGIVFGRYLIDSRQLRLYRMRAEA